MRVFMRVAILPIVLVLAGCEQPAPYGPQVVSPTGRAPAINQLMSTNAEYYRVGAPVSIRLTNTTGRVVSYNLCRSSLELEANDGWRRIQQTLAPACTAELRTLAPGQSTTYGFRTSPQLKRGLYRIHTVLHDAYGNAPYEAVSNTFNLQRDADD